MKWVVDVQRAIDSIQPGVKLGAVNIDVETVGDCFRPLLTTYMSNSMKAHGVDIPVGDTVGFDSFQYIFDHFGVDSTLPTTNQSVAATTGLWIQNYNLPAESPQEKGFGQYVGEYVLSIPPDAKNAFMSIMWSMNCCDGPCSNPASGNPSGAPLCLCGCLPVPFLPSHLTCYILRPSRLR